MTVRPYGKPSGFTLMNVLITIFLVFTVIVAVIPLFQSMSRVERGASERIQALWLLHGVMVQIRTGEMPAPLPGTSATVTVPNAPDPAGTVTVQTRITSDSALVEVEVSCRWSSLGGERSASLTEWMNAAVIR